MRLLGAMLVGGAAASIVGRHSARRQFEAMSAAQAQQEQINQAQAQAAQAAQVQAAQAQAPNQGKKDTIQELERLGRLKHQGLITEEEFQKFKTQLLSSI